MKKILFAASLIITSLAVQAQDTPRHKKPKETKDVNVLDVTKNQGTIIEYETPAERKAEFEKKAALNLWTAEKKAEEAALLPEGGYLVLKVNRLSISEADTKYFTVVAQDEAGKEILRQELESSVPNHSDANGLTIWSNLKIVRVPVELKTGYKIFVVDAMRKNRHEYLIQN